MKRWIAALALACLPACALAVTEGVIEAAPPVELEPIEIRTDSYLPRAGAGASDVVWIRVEGYTFGDAHGVGDGYPLSADAMVRRKLTVDERRRAVHLLAAYEAGEATGDGLSVLEAEKQVVVGVYALDPADYDGERVLTLLPVGELSDEQILAVIDAHARLGLRFDPYGLNARNCVRGHTVMRSLTEDEIARSETLRTQAASGVLPAEQIGAQAQRRIELDRKHFYGAYGDGLFFFTPYRRLTDEELAGRQLMLQTAPEDAQRQAIERAARTHIAEKLGCPLNMRLTKIDMQEQPDAYIAEFVCEDEKGNGWCVRATLAQDLAPVTLVRYRERFTGRPGRPADEDCTRIAQDFAHEQLGRDGLHFTQRKTEKDRTDMWADLDGGRMRLALYGREGVVTTATWNRTLEGESFPRQDHPAP